MQGASAGLASCVPWPAMPRSSGGGWRQIGLQATVKSVSRGEASPLLASLGWPWPVPRLLKIYTAATLPRLYTLAVLRSESRLLHVSGIRPSTVLYIKVARIGLSLRDVAADTDAADGPHSLGMQ